MIAAHSTRIVPAGDFDLATLLDRRPTTEHPAICWLGQAGFLLSWQDTLLLIDPYLSDSLAKKYRGTHFPHTRMMPPPIDPEQLTGVDAVLCTHAHTDHMDPETLSTIAQRNPNCQFVVPCAAQETALSRGVPGNRLVAINAGERAPALPGTTIQAIASAHEELQIDELGNHHFLGYVVSFSKLALYHSGDCAPYPGLVTELAPWSIDLALLPVNGRDELRRQQGVPGNFTFAEAAALCADAGIPAMIPCHFGMFDFNTVDPAWLDRQMADVSRSLACMRLTAGRVYWLEKQPPSKQ